LPKDWIEDMERRKAASIPDDVTFATKPKIGIAMVKAALDADVPCAWVLGDSSDKNLRVMLERHHKPYVLSIRGNERLVMGDFRTHTAADLAAGLSSDEWFRHDNRDVRARFHGAERFANGTR
jgi:SRSO17 transposase